ncbi:MAG: hypothetical protein IPO61_05965 [Gammaproteobacteria bacterium]|nr:hypothetical protein [Gammaproteobacteria bacterium]
MLDLELAHLGDPASDLGALFVRDLSEPLGPLPHAVRRYAELSGREMDPHVVNWHAVRVGICVPMSTASTLYKPNPDEPVQYIAWYHVYARMAIEVMALEVGVELEEPPVPGARFRASGPGVWCAREASLRCEGSGQLRGLSGRDRCACCRIPASLGVLRTGPRIR